MAKKKTTITIDFRDLEQANNEQNATTYYGGTIRVSDGTKTIVGNAAGTDRDDQIRHDVWGAIAQLLGRDMTDEECDAMMDLDGDIGNNSFNLCIGRCAYEFPGAKTVPAPDLGLKTVAAFVTLPAAQAENAERLIREALGFLSLHDSVYAIETREPLIAEEDIWKANTSVGRMSQ